MKRLLLLFCFLVLCLLTNAQNGDIDNFVRLEAVGKIPSNLLEIANSDEILENDYEEGLRNQIKTFILSGKIVFGDTVSNYVNNIVDLLLKDEPKLREKIKVYVIKSSQANAFATSKGYLFITTGFIAQSTCEAELAFAISHEIIHFTKKHGYSLKDDFDGVNDFLTYHSRSREQEFECDREGYLNYYSKAGYFKSSSMGVYDILQYSYLPFDEKKLSRAFFETEYFQFKDNYFLESVTPISSRENYIDTFSTHPNLKSRRFEMEKLINANVNEEGKEFVQSKEAYEHIRTICRFETINQQIMEDNYIKSYYNTIILEDKFPGNKFLRTAKIASIYGISKVKTYGNYSRYLLTKKETEGEIQFIANFFEKANKKEIALLALREIYGGIKQENSKYYSALMDDIINDLSKNMKFDGLNLFSDLKMNEVYVEDSTTKDENSKLSKYDKIKSSKIIGHQKGFKTENYMLADLKKDSGFVKIFENAISKNEKKLAGDIIDEIKEEEGEEEEEEKSLQIKTLIVFEPNMITYNKHNEVKSSSEKSAKVAQSFDKMIEKIAEENGVKTIIMSNSNFDTNFSYQLRAKIHDFGMGLNRFGDIYYETRDIENYAKELNSQYLSFISLQKYKKIDNNVGYKLTHSVMSAIFAYPFLPISVYQWMNQKYTGELNFLVYDLKNYNFAYNNRISFGYENTKDFEKKALDEHFKKINDEESSIYKRHGYKGKRFIFRVDANLSPAFITPNKFGDNGPLYFDYSINPNIEFVVSKTFSVGVGMSYFDTKFKCSEVDYSDQYPNLGSLNVIGYSIFMKSYKAVAPLGYYYKVQFDYFQYTPNLVYRAFIIDQNNNWYYKEKVFEEKGYNIGFKVEFGKVFFVNDYFQIGAGCSLGITSKGWGSLSGFDEPSIQEVIDNKIRRLYFLGINLNIGFLAF
ncbi:MAG: M48 family metallopeptidase [Bacteroidales bacterium]